MCGWNFIILFNGKRNIRTVQICMHEDRSIHWRPRRSFRGDGWVVNWTTGLCNTTRMSCYEFCRGNDTGLMWWQTPRDLLIVIVMPVNVTCLPKQWHDVRFRFVAWITERFSSGFVGSIFLCICNDCTMITSCS